LVNKSPLPQVDHGIDVCGDEWDEPVGREEYVGVTMIKQHNPKHPYCTNWPVRKTKETNEKV
jgi:hypothetical protein